jgi:secreted PhoX family phosphatase
MLVKGMLNNCGGGVTPWRTVLTCEENFNQYFMGRLPAGSKEEVSHARLLIRASGGGMEWGKDVARFDRSKEPNEANRFGWVVEIDPYDPQFRPVKRTALGRFKHEAATTALASDGRVVVYMGDDQPNEYIYKYVSTKPYDAAQPGLAQGLLDDGTLFVAKFSDTTVDWLPLVQGQGPLTADKGFTSQADVLIDPRSAAELLGATPMDRPEDVEANPLTGRVYVMLTGNAGRAVNQIDNANPRNWNQYGHILELVPPAGQNGKPDHAATTFNWDILLLAGFEAEVKDGEAKPLWSARYGEGTKVVMMNPDNCAFDPKGRLWVATDSAHELTKRPDGLYACELDGSARAVVKLLYTAPDGAEICGPEFTPNGETLFVAIQHPGGDATDLKQPQWPDFVTGLPARASVIVISRIGGGSIGG